MPGGFQRINPLGDGIIRGPARLLVAPITQAFPTNLSQIVNIPGNPAWTATSEVQTITMTGTPTGGTFQLSFNSVQSATIPYNATLAQVLAALTSLPGIGAGGVTGTGGPFPATPIIVTFAGANALAAQPLISAQAAGLTGGTTPAVTVVRTTPGVGQWDPVSGWVELGSTRSGVQASRNNTETQLDVDQVYASILAIPDEWEMQIATQFAETTLENIQMAWEGGTITVDATQSPNERHLPLGNPLSYVSRRLAVLHQKTIGTSAGRIRAMVYRNVQRSPQNSTLDYQKTGQMQTIAHTFRAFADPTVSDPNARFADLVDQLPF